MLVAELYNMVDTIFVGRAIGGNGIGALIVVFPIQRLMIALSMMIAIGSSTSIARSNGEKDFEKLGDAIKNALSLIVVIMIPLMAITIIFKDKVLLLLGGSENTIPYAKEYLNIVVFGFIFQCFTTCIAYIMMALGNRKIPLISTSIGAISNVIIDYILVVAIPCGIKGAAIATVISQIISFLYAYHHFHEVIKTFNISLGFKCNKEVWLSILTIGFSAFIVEFEDGLVAAILNNLLLRYEGEIGVIVLGIISKVSMFMFINIIGVSAAMQPIAAYNVGAKNYKRLREVVKKSIIAGFCSSAALWAGGLVFADKIISIFITDPYIIAKSAKAFRIMILLFPINSMYYLSIYYFQALGKAKTSFLVSIFRQLIILLPVSFVMLTVFDLGAMGVWISYPISDLVSSITSHFLMRRERNKLENKIQKQKEKKKQKEGYSIPAYDS